jgi:hypothetical protein
MLPLGLLLHEITEYKLQKLKQGLALTFVTLKRKCECIIKAVELNCRG